jgi:hypothetical protein
MIQESNMGDIGTILDRISKLREFEVDVDLPEGFRLSGVMPFNATLSKTKGKFKVFAISFAEAEQKINEYIAKNTV